MRLIDFRYRPATRESIDSVRFNPVYEIFCQRTPFLSQPVVSMDEALAEIRAAGMVRAVVTGRDIESTYRSPSTNPSVRACVQAAPDLFAGFYGFDPMKGMKAVAGLREAVASGDFCGASIDPAMAHLPLDHPRFYMLYTTCCDLDIPITVTTGLSPYMPDVVMDDCHPRHLDRVATDFPDLKLVVSHAGYPWVSETKAVAMRHDHVCLDFSAVEGMPGVREALLTALTHPMLKDKILFSSASPFNSLSNALAFCRSLNLDEATMDRLMYANAAAVLGL